MFKSIKKYENLHIVLWILKDTCWILSFKTLGLIMFIPTFCVALHIVWLSRKQIGNFLHNIAVVFWISANGTWMLGEFFYNDGTRPYSVVFFTLGLFVLSYYYLILYPKEKNER